MSIETKDITIKYEFGKQRTKNTSSSNKRKNISSRICGSGMLLGPYFFKRSVTGINSPKVLKKYNYVLLKEECDHFDNGTLSRKSKKPYFSLVSVL